MSTEKPKVATASLAGCFGCHMSILDIDDRILQLIDLVDFDKSPVDDIKEFTGRCAVGLIEGGCCNEENVRVLQDFRKHCDVLISLGECAICGGIPAMRNNVPLTIGTGREHPGCICGEVIKGKCTPADCPMFAKACHPDHPIGPCMVSAEGTCAAYFKYSR
jgi:hypothetical protein